MSSEDMPRFNARLTKEQKEFFEYASILGGFRSLTDFIIQSAQRRAKEIVEEHNQILTSKKDREIFFDAIMNPPQPNQDLKDALVAVRKALSSNC